MDKAGRISEQSELLKNGLNLLFVSRLCESKPQHIYILLMLVSNLKWGTQDISELNLLYLYFKYTLEEKCNGFWIQEAYSWNSEYKVEAGGMSHIWWAEDPHGACKDTKLY